MRGGLRRLRLIAVGLMLVAAAGLAPLVVTAQGAALTRPPVTAVIWDPGVILLEVARGYDMYSIVIEHGDSPTNLSRVFLEPFDDVSIENGLDRFFDLTVPLGQEQVKVEEYARDDRIEYVQRENNLFGRELPSDS